MPNDYDIIAVAFADADRHARRGRLRLDPDCPPASAATPTPSSRRTSQAQARGAARRSSSRSAARTAPSRWPSAASATNFANSVYALMQSYGFDGVDIDLENGLNATYMAPGAAVAARQGRRRPDHHDGAADHRHAVHRRRVLPARAEHQGHPDRRQHAVLQLRLDARLRRQASTPRARSNFLTALACIQLESGLRPDQVGLGVPAVDRRGRRRRSSPRPWSTRPWTAWRRGTNCGSFKPPRTCPGIRGAMTWSTNWDASNNWNFSRTVKPHLATLP